MNEITLPSGAVIKAAAQNGRICLMAEPAGGAGEPVLLDEINDVRCADPHLLIGKNGALRLFYTAFPGVDIDTAQPMFRYAEKGNYGDNFVKWDRRDAVYPRLGGSFTDGRQSDGVNEARDTFAPELCARYKQIGSLLAEKLGFDAEAFGRFVEEKRLLALGKLYGVKTKKYNYPFARRTGFSLRGAPLEFDFYGKNALVLPLYSNAFRCALLAYSFDNGENFDSGDYVICPLGEKDEFVLNETRREINLAALTPTGLRPVGNTPDLGGTWETLPDYTDFSYTVKSGVVPKPKQSRQRHFSVKVFAKPAPVKGWRFVKQMVRNERPLDYLKKKPPAAVPCEPFEPVKIEGLDGYETPVIEDIFPLIKEHTHGSGIACLPDGELLSVWFQSDGERQGNDGRILAARKPAGAAWLEPFVIADVAGMADCNPTVFLDQTQRLWFFWYPVLANCWETSQPKYRVAEKGCYEFANGYIKSPKWSLQGILNPGRPDELQGRVVGFENGRYLYGEVNGECRYITAAQFAEHPLPKKEYIQFEDRYITDPFVIAYRNSILDTVDFFRKNRVYAGLTPALEIYLRWESERVCRVAAGVEDGYKKWRPVTRPLGWQTKNKPIEFDFEGKTRLLIPLYSDGLHCCLTAYTDDGGETWGYGLPFGSIAPEQAASVQLKDGRLRSYFRNSTPTGNIISCESADGGETFANLQINAALRHEGGFDIVKLKNGLWVMSVTDPYLAKGVRPHNRARLRIAVSKDEGKTWECTPLELDTAGRRAFHYSAVTEGPDGNIYVSYSHDDEQGMNNIRCAVIKKQGIV